MWTPLCATIEPILHFWYKRRRYIWIILRHSRRRSRVSDVIYKGRSADVQLNLAFVDSLFPTATEHNITRFSSDVVESFRWSKNHNNTRLYICEQIWISCSEGLRHNTATRELKSLELWGWMDKFSTFWYFKHFLSIMWITSILFS